MRLKKIHRVLEFTQKKWVKEYMYFNSEKRSDGKNSFEKDVFKLMNNSVFGKTMETLTKRSNIHLVTDEEFLLKLTTKPTFVSSKIFDENLVGIQMKRDIVFLNKPFSILEMSKTLMYDFHYNYMRKKYPSAKLLFTDTDSLVYYIKTEDIYEDLCKDRSLFDNSDYPESSKFFFKENKKKLLVNLKMRHQGSQLLNLLVLKVKCILIKQNKKKRAVKKNVTKRELDHSHYKDALLNIKTMRHKMRTIRSDHHQISSYQINKISLSPFDDKRYILRDGISSYAYGHKNLKSI